jgi:hypothetical protein
MYARSLYGNREVSPLTGGASRSGPHREGAEPKPVMHDGEKSDCKFARNSGSDSISVQPAKRCGGKV